MSSKLLVLSGKPRPVPNDGEPADDADLWDVGRVAKFLGMSPSWVYRASEAGTLPYMKIANRLRFQPREIVTWAKKQRSESAA